MSDEKRIKELDRIIAEAQRERSKLVAAHVCVIPEKSAPSTRYGYEDWGSAQCKCGKYHGWYCPKSPDHRCYYFTQAGKVLMKDGTLEDPPPEHDTDYESDDWCVFCGSPDERK